MTRRKDITQSQPVTPDKWERQRQAERITLQDRKTVPQTKWEAQRNKERIAVLLNMRKAA